MIGAILGDMIGSPYERHNTKSKEFPLFSRKTRFTDDTVMTVAVADGIMSVFDNPEDPVRGPEDICPEDMDRIRASVIRSMKLFGLRYPNAGYGGRFISWLKSGTEPYYSWGNGSAMRTSPVAWMFSDLSMVRRMAALQAAVTHDHPEGIKGAEAVASAIWLARTGSSKTEIREYVVREFGYDLSKTCDEIRPDYEFDVSCQGSVPQAITAFLDGESWEDVVRTAVSLGGDSDTIGAMAGSIAEGFYGIPDELVSLCLKKLPEDLANVTVRFMRRFRQE